MFVRATLVRVLTAGFVTAAAASWQARLV